MGSSRSSIIHLGGRALIGIQILGDEVFAGLLIIAIVIAVVIIEIIVGFVEGKSSGLLGSHLDIAEVGGFLANSIACSQTEGTIPIIHIVAPFAGG